MGSIASVGMSVPPSVKYVDDKKGEKGHPPDRVVWIRTCVINTHYHNSNLIWRTVSRRVDEIIPSDRVEGDPIVWPHPRDVIL